MEEENLSGGAGVLPESSPSEKRQKRIGEGDTGVSSSSGKNDDGKVYSADLSLQEFGKWIVANGGYIDPSLILHKDASTGEISVRLKSSWIPPADGSPRLPKKLVSTPTSLTFSLSSPPTLLPKQFEESPTVTQHSRLCFRICSHILAGTESKFYQYFRQLPETFGTPLELNDDELLVLQGTNAMIEVSARKQRWIEEWEAGVRVLSGNGASTEGYTWPLYLRAGLIVSSRAFPSKLLDDVKRDSQAAPEFAKDSTPILIPLWDFLNHKLTPVTWLHNENELELLSNTDISIWRAGDEVFNNYGAKGNEELLLSYGFCLEDSPSDYVSMKFKVPPLPPSKQELLGLLPSSKNWPAEDVFFLRKDNNSTLNDGTPRPLVDYWPEPLLDVFRLLLCNEVEETAWETTFLRGGGGRFISPTRLELSVAAQLHRATSVKLVPILETKKANLTAFESSSSKGVKAAIIYRDGQIKILQSLLMHLGDFLAKYDSQNRMSLSKMCGSDDNFSKAITSHFGKSVHRLSSDEKDDLFAVAIVDKYLQVIYKLGPLGGHDTQNRHRIGTPIMDPWWKNWIEMMQRIHPFPFEDERLESFHSDDFNEVLGSGEEGDEAGEHVFRNVYEPLRTEQYYFYWNASPGLCSWALELMGISGIEINGELVLTL